MTAIGELNRRLVIEAPVETPDGAGGVARSYAAAATVWASIVPVDATAGIVAQALGATVTHRIVIRPGPALTAQHRFRDGARLFYVVGVREREDRRFLEIEAHERAD
jgi:SPP1 family predicted phage head-tail adaptor